ncbi:MAG: hypothetical protein AVW05_02920 [Hadesarchaea archaeon DG-33]|nr:MAG: hypothetical protein AVW05_02920 [Hadesarchaea archaeon DG-33]
MPREARLDVLGALHHIMVFEINKFASGKSLYECGRDCPLPRGATSSITMSIEKMVDGKG